MVHHVAQLTKGKRRAPMTRLEAARPAGDTARGIRNGEPWSWAGIGTVEGAELLASLVTMLTTYGQYAWVELASMWPMASGYAGAVITGRRLGMDRGNDGARARSSSAPS